MSIRHQIMPTAPHPGVFLYKYLNEKGLSQKEFASALGVRPPLLNMIVTGKRGISAAVRPLIARETKIPESDWLRWERLHEEGKRIAVEGGEYVAPVLPGILSNQDLRRVLQSGGVKVNPLGMGSIQESSIDLTLGESGRLPSPAWLNVPIEREDLARLVERPIDILPGETWRVWAREEVWLARHFCGRIAGSSEFTLHGIIVNFGIQINPGWSGRPFVSLFNPTGEIFDLEPGDTVMSLEIHALSSAAVLEPDVEEVPDA